MNYFTFITQKYFFQFGHVVTEISVQTTNYISFYEINLNKTVSIIILYYIIFMFSQYIL